MFKDLFKLNSFEDNRFIDIKSIKYTTWYLEYQLALAFVEYNKATDINEYMENVYFPIKISRLKLVEYIHNNHRDWKHNKLYYINLIKKTNDFSFKLMDYMYEDELLDNVCKHTLSSNWNFDSMFDDLLRYYSRYNSDIREHVKAVRYNIFKNFEFYNEKIKNVLSAIDDQVANIPINLLVDNRYIRNLLIANNIFCINDLKSKASEIVIGIFCVDIDSFFYKIEKQNISDITIILNRIFSILDNKEYEIISRRNGFLNNKKQTLEEIGTDFNLTRERIRQIELKSLNKLLPEMNEYKINISYFLYKQLKENDYLDRLYLESILNDEEINKLFFIVSVMDLNYKFDEEYEIIYDNEINSIENLVSNKISNFSLYFSENIFKTIKFDSFEKKIISNFYNLNKTGVYIRKGLHYIDLLSSVIDECLPNGYHPGIEEDYLLILKTFKKKFNLSEDLPESQNAIRATMDRSDYVLIDRGTYMNYKYTNHLTKQLENKILNFIQEQEDVVYYTTVYEKYKNELNKLGISNSYYLKGQIDSKLPDDFVTKRNYIKTSDNRFTARQIMKNMIRNFSSDFHLSEIKERFPGIKDYIIYNCLYENEVVFLSEKRFILPDKISDHFINLCKKEIDILFKNFENEVINSRKIWTKMKFKYKEEIVQYPWMRTHFDLFSVLKVKLGKEYEFHRPYILRKGSNEGYFNIDLYRNYANTLDQFTNNDMKKYQLKINALRLYSYSKFIEVMSDNYVQVDIETMVKKEKLNISIEKIEEIHSLMELLFLHTNEINTLTFNAFAIFPKINYKWNKYLLVGVLRSYLSDYYEVVNTTNYYNTTEYIIRRLNNE